MRARDIHRDQIYVIGDPYRVARLALRSTATTPTVDRAAGLALNGLDLFRVDGFAGTAARVTKVTGVHLGPARVGTRGEVMLGRVLLTVEDFDQLLAEHSERLRSEAADRRADQIARDEADGWSHMGNGHACTGCGAYIKDFRGETLNRDRHTNFHTRLDAALGAHGAAPADAS